MSSNGNEWLNPKPLQAEQQAPLLPTREIPVSNGITSRSSNRYEWLHPTAHKAEQQAPLLAIKEISSSNDIPFKSSNRYEWLHPSDPQAEQLDPHLPARENPNSSDISSISSNRYEWLHPNAPQVEQQAHQAEQQASLLPTREILDSNDIPSMSSIRYEWLHPNAPQVEQQAHQAEQQASLLPTREIPDSNEIPSMSSNRYEWLHPSAPQVEKQAPLLPAREIPDSNSIPSMSSNGYEGLNASALQAKQQALTLPNREIPSSHDIPSMSSNRYEWLHPSAAQAEQQDPLLPAREIPSSNDIHYMSSNRYEWLHPNAPQAEQQAHQAEQQAPLLPIREIPSSHGIPSMNSNRYEWLHPSDPQAEQQDPHLPAREIPSSSDIPSMSSNRYEWLHPNTTQVEQQAPLLPTRETPDNNIPSMSSNRYERLHPSASQVEQQAPKAKQQAPLLPIREIPGSYGIPFISPIKDRLDYYYFKGHDNFFQSKINLYGSTVFRTNIIPGPFMACNPHVIAVLDAKSFPVLFDTSKVEKKNVLTGTYMPNTKFTGGYRVCSYLDPSEPTHAKVKQFLFNLLATRKDYFLPAFRSAYVAPVFSTIESKVASSGQVDFNELNNDIAFDFLGEAYFGVKPSKVGAGGLKVTIWLLLQLAPLASNILTKFGIPRLVEDLLLHTFPLPWIIARLLGYNKMLDYFKSAGTAALESADKVGLLPDEACHNLLFATIFNTYGGLRVLFPGLLKRLAQSGRDLHKRLASEVRQAVAEHGENGQVTLAALEKMELANSVVYEVLRIDPPVEFQYAHAKKDFVLESHDAAFQVHKGEMLFGYQPFATRDTRVFGPNAGEFVPDRFVGSDGAKLLRYVWWSNGPETETPTVDNKQCAGKNFVVLVARLFVAEFFLAYDSFTAEVSNSFTGAQIDITSITKAKKPSAGKYYY